MSHLGDVRAMVGAIQVDSDFCIVVHTQHGSQVESSGIGASGRHQGEICKQLGLDQGGTVHQRQNLRGQARFSLEDLYQPVYIRYYIWTFD
jgi:hypothetical protein